MLKRCTFLLFCLLIVSQLYVCGVHAGDKTVDEECNTSSDCKTGLWCKPLSEIASTCQLCLNNPKDRNAKDCGDTGANCEYTDHGDSNGYCPWKLTCDNGTVFEIDETRKSGACKTCNEIMDDPYYHYACSLGTDGSYVVKWDGTNFSYHTTIPYEMFEDDQPMYSSTNPATCVGKPYVVSINCNGGNDCPTEVYRQYGNETGWFTDTSFQQQLPNSTLTPLPSRKRHLFQGYYLDPDDADTQIFDASGQLKPAGNTLISGTATLFAKWVLGGNYTIIVDDECGSLSNFNSSCSFANTYCDMNHSFDGTRYNGKEFHWDTDNCGTLSSDFQKFYLSDDCDIDNGDSIEITLTCTSCPAGSYCKSGQITSCPTNTTSFAGSYEKSACHYYSGTVFRDSVGSFSLPVGEDGIITVKWDY